MVISLPRYTIALYINTYFSSKKPDHARYELSHLAPYDVVDVPSLRNEAVLQHQDTRLHLDPRHNDFRAQLRLPNRLSSPKTARMQAKML